MSAWDLPITVQVAGRVFAIRSDFRAVLDALAALTDPDLTQQEQYIACLQILYPRWKELPDANAALRAAFTFINEGKEDEKQGFRPRLVDWEQDAALIAPAVDKVLGYSCRRCGYLHWWEFLGAFHGIGDGLFAQVASMRSAGENLKAIWNAFWLTIKLIGMQIWENITTAWSNFWQGLHRLLNSAGAALQSAWSSAWTALGNTVKKIWDGIVGTIKTAVNSVISLVNGMISAVVGGVNAVIGVLNGFSFDVPEFAQGALGTAKIGFNIDPITAPQIPYLAQGAVIPANHEFLAVLGDQTNGTNVEAPLETIQEALAEVLAAQGGQEITIRFAGDLAQLVRLLNPYIDKENNRRGARLVSGGVY